MNYRGGLKMEKTLPLVETIIKESCEKTGMDFERLWIG